MEEETSIVKQLLPSHYTCEPRDNGVRCSSSIGIFDTHDDLAFDMFMNALRYIFKERLIEVYHRTCTYHEDFTVFLRPKS